MFLSDPLSLARIALFAVAGYFLVLVLVRLLGARTISKMNPSDFVATVAVGSVVANLVLSKNVVLLEGAVAITVLLGLQIGTEWAAARSAFVRGLLEGVPKLVFYEGQFVRPVLLAEHISETAVYKAIREQGISDLEQVHAVILEIDGSFSVISGGDRRSESALDDVRRPATPSV